MSEAATTPKNEPVRPEPETSEEGTGLGSVQVHHNVMAVIARLTAEKVPGVFALSGTLVDDLAGMIGKKVSEHGIRVQQDGQNVTIDLNVIVIYGARIPEVAWRLQNDVREAVQQMTGNTVRAVNISVRGVQLPEDKTGETRSGA